MNKRTETFIVGKRGSLKIKTASGVRVTRNEGDMIPEAAFLPANILRANISNGNILKCVVIERIAKAAKKTKKVKKKAG